MIQPKRRRAARQKKTGHQVMTGFLFFSTEVEFESFGLVRKARAILFSGPSLNFLCELPSDKGAKPECR